MTKTSCTLPDTWRMRQAIYISPAITIGKHEWCCVVYRHANYGAGTDYHWRKRTTVAGADADHWASEQEWPRYDSNDTYSGLPRRLRSLWGRHHPHIEAALTSGKGGAS